VNTSGGPEVPEEVRGLAAERDDARARKDFAAADALRDRIAEMGFEVADSLQGPTLRPLAPRSEATARIPASEVRSLLDDPATFDVSVQWVHEGWAEDVLRALRAFRADEGGRRVQYVVADVTGADPASFGDGIEVLSLAEGTGWAAARNAGLRRSLGRIVLVVDGSVAPVGEVFGPLEEALADPTVGVCGPFGITSRDLHSFEESDGPDVDAIEGYLMAMRREVLQLAGLFGERFRWYRTADIEYSFRVKDQGLRAVVVHIPVTKHEHRAWTSTSEADRERWSKRNFNIFLDAFRGRTDLLVKPGEPGESGA
jgi:Glycosyl transferase family 2